MIFTAKSLIYTCATGALGLIFFYLFMSLGMSIIGLEFFRKAGGEKIDEAIIKWYKFKKKKNVIYMYTEDRGGK